MDETNYKLGILAYGSLVNDPGPELARYIIAKVPCTTPFSVEYARLSRSRCEAPTLIPVVNEAGQPVNAVILVLDNKVSVDMVESMLYRREIRSTNLSKQYVRPDKPTMDSVLIERIENFHGVATVLYTSIQSNMGMFVTAEILAHFAIRSILDTAGAEKKDGIRYLKANIDNGIETKLTIPYRNAILQQTSTISLQEAIEKLDRARPEALQRKSELAEFEKKYIELTDLVCQYGIEHTEGLDRDDPEKIQESIKKAGDQFMIKVHEGWKKAQKIALQLIMDIQEQSGKLKESLKEANRKKDKKQKSNIEAELQYCSFKENLIRHLMDMIVWQLLQGQLYLSRRLYHKVDGAIQLKNSNIESVVNVADKINEKGIDFALITDLTGYVQSGDLLCLIDKKLIQCEVKEGDKNLKIIEILGEIKSGSIKVDEAIANYNLNKKDLDQLHRQAKQISTMENFINIANTDKGIDPISGEPIKILTPKESTPRFMEELYDLRQQMDQRNLFGYTVIDDCLHIGMYKGPFRFVGMRLLQTIGEQKSNNVIVFDYLNVIQSLNKPLFTLPFEKEYLFDIIFGRVKLLFMVDLDALIELAGKVGLVAGWATEKETNKVKAIAGKHGIFIYKGKGIIVSNPKKPEDKSSWIADGTIHKMIFEHIYPSYVLYSHHYYFELFEKENKNEEPKS